MFVVTIFIGSNQTDNGNEFCSFTMPSGYQVISSLLMTIFFFSFNVDSKINNSNVQSESFKNRICSLCAKADKRSPLQHRVGYTFVEDSVGLVAFSTVDHSRFPSTTDNCKQCSQLFIPTKHVRKLSGFSTYGRHQGFDFLGFLVICSC